MEKAIITENSNRFSLVYTSQIFNPEIIKQIGYLGQSNKVENLINQNISIEIPNKDINSFLALMYQPNLFKVSTNIDLNH